MTTDEEVLLYISGAGKSESDLTQRFPGFDIARLVRAQLVMTVSEEPTEIEAHVLNVEPKALRWVLTSRGAEALGLSNAGPEASTET